jgi:CRP/FNR family transcriptional regulator
MPRHPAPRTPDCDPECVPCLLARLSRSPGGGLELVGRHVPAGAWIFREGEPLQFLYAVRHGSLRVSAMAREGLEQVTAFRGAGELLGLDAMADECHATSAVALEDCEVVSVPYTALLEVLALQPDLAQAFCRLLSRELVRGKKRLLLLGTLKAEERVAAFLLNMVVRIAPGEESPTELPIPMTRADIGSYLGLTLESVSRILHRFQARGWLELNHRRLRVVAPGALRAFFTPHAVPAKGLQ